MLWCEMSPGVVAVVVEVVAVVVVVANDDDDDDDNVLAGAGASEEVHTPLLGHGLYGVGPVSNHLPVSGSVTRTGAAQVCMLHMQTYS